MRNRSLYIDQFTFLQVISLSESISLFPHAQLTDKRSLQEQEAINSYTSLETMHEACEQGRDDLAINYYDTYVLKEMILKNLPYTKPLIQIPSNTHTATKSISLSLVSDKTQFL